MLGVFGECLLKTYKMVLCRAGNQLEVWLMSNRICDYEMNRIEYHFDKSLKAKTDHYYFGKNFSFNLVSTNGMYIAVF